jgi:hypothetical protein
MSVVHPTICGMDLIRVKRFWQSNINRWIKDGWPWLDQAEAVCSPEIEQSVARPLAHGSARPNCRRQRHDDSGEGLSLRFSLKWSRGDMRSLPAASRGWGGGRMGWLRWPLFSDLGRRWSSGSGDTSYGGGKAWGNSSGGQLSGGGVTIVGR